MSTYNGGSFLKKQLDSIFAQEDVQVTLVVRDDGSKDDTVRLIRDYIEGGKNIVLIEGENLGWQKSFHWLLENAKTYGNFQYYSFADQDDYWLPRKLISAIEKLETAENPKALYGSQLLCVYEETGISQNLYPDIDRTKRELATQYLFGIAPFGCSMVWTDALQELYLKHHMDVKIPHDIWMHILARTCGEAIIDENAYIEHRIHGNNAAGVEQSVFGRFKKFFKVYMNTGYMRNSQIMEKFVSAYGMQSIPDEYKQFVQHMIAYRGSFIHTIKLLNTKYFKTLGIKRQARTLLFLLLRKL